MEGRKIPPRLENPVDNVLIKIADALSEPLYRTGHTPNVLTTYSLVLGVGAVWALYYGHVYMFVALWFASYFFDCADGHFARKYSMMTKFGDLYDHTKDNMVFAAWVAVMWIKYDVKVWTVVVLAIVALGSAIQLGCQQRVHGDPDESLNRLGCPGDPHTVLPVSRFFGIGTLQVAIALVTLASRRV